MHRNYFRSILYMSKYRLFFEKLNLLGAVDYLERVLRREVNICVIIVLLRDQIVYSVAC